MSTLVIRYHPADPKPWHVSGQGATINFYCRVNNLQIARHIAGTTQRDWYPNADIVEEITPRERRDRCMGRRHYDY